MSALASACFDCSLAGSLAGLPRCADGEPFEEKMKRLVAQLEAQFAEGAKLEKEIRKNLRGLAHGP